MGGHALKMFRLTVKRGWSVCIIAYNGNTKQAERARLIVQASTAAELSTGRGVFQKHLFFILRWPRVTLPPCRPQSPFAGFYQPSRSFILFCQPWRPGFNFPRAGLMQEKHSVIDMYHCINKTWYLRKNKGKQAEINIFSLYFLNFIHYIVVAIYPRYLIVDSSNI